MRERRHGLDELVHLGAEQVLVVAGLDRFCTIRCACTGSLLIVFSSHLLHPTAQRARWGCMYSTD